MNKEYNDMIRIYDVLSDGFVNKDEAYEKIELFYSNLSGITTYFCNGEYYIVRSRYY